MEQANQELYKTLGAIIRRRRRTLDFTQDQLAQRMGISRGALANIETGRQNVLLHQLYRFAAALGDMDVHDLMPSITKPAQTASAALPLPKGLTSEQKNQISRVFNDAVPRKSPITKAE